MITKNGYSISEGNTKVGFMPSFSVMPGSTCAKCVYDICFKYCYAMKAVRLFQNVRIALERNTNMLRAGMYDKLLEDISEYIDGRSESRKPVCTFRFNVSGDIFEERYLKLMCDLAVKYPSIQFWTYTKQFGIVSGYNGEIPSNLHILLSAWNEFQPPEELKARFHVAHYDDGKHCELIPDGAFRCPASGGKKDKDGIKCEKCRMCAIGNCDIVFHKH